MLRPVLEHVTFQIAHDDTSSFLRNSFRNELFFALSAAASRPRFQSRLRVRCTLRDGNLSSKSYARRTTRLQRGKMKRLWERVHLLIIIGRTHRSN